MQNFRKTLISKTPTTPDEVVTKGYAKKMIRESSGGSANIININMVIIENDNTTITCDKAISEILELEKNNRLRFNFTYNLSEIECTGSSEMYNPFTFKKEDSLVKGIAFMMFYLGTTPIIIIGYTDGNTDMWEAVV